MGSVDLEWRLTKTLAPVLGPSNFIFTQETLDEKDEEPDSDFVKLTTKLEESHEEPTFQNFIKELMAQN